MVPPGASAAALRTNCAPIVGVLGETAGVWYRSKGAVAGLRHCEMSWTPAKAVLLAALTSEQHTTPALRASAFCSRAAPAPGCVRRQSSWGQRSRQEVEAGQSAEAGVGPPHAGPSVPRLREGRRVIQRARHVPDAVSPAAQPEEPALFRRHLTGKNVWALSRPELPLRMRPQQHPYPVASVPRAEAIPGAPTSAGGQSTEQRPGPRGAMCSEAGQNGGHALSSLDVLYDLGKAPSPHCRHL